MTREIKSLLKRWEQLLDKGTSSVNFKMFSINSRLNLEGA